jgi:Flp pilus assembly protein TadG
MEARRRIGSRHGDRGQSLVEFVLVLPILLVIIFGIIEFANAWRTSQIITNTAREVARQAILPSSTQQAAHDTAVSRLNGSGLNASKATITLNLCSGSGCTGKPDQVTIGYPYSFQFFGPVMNLMCGSGCSSKFGTINLSSTAVMRNE